MDPNIATSVIYALRYWGCATQARTQISDAFGFTPKSCIESSEVSKKTIAPLPFALMPYLSTHPSVDWDMALKDRREDSRNLLHSENNTSKSLVKFDSTKKSVTLFMPGFDKSEIKLYQYRGGSELLVEAGDQQRIIRLPSGIQGKDTWLEVDPDELSYEELLALGEVVGTENRGLSADLIASLPFVTYKGQSSQDGNTDQCVICRLDYEDGDALIVLSCKHMYHPECINNWLQINKVLTNGIEVKLQRNALSVIEPPTGLEEDDDIECENMVWNGSDMGGLFHASTAIGFAVGLCQEDRSICGFNFSWCFGTSHRSWRRPIL